MNKYFLSELTEAVLCEIGLFLFWEKKLKKLKSMMIQALRICMKGKSEINFIKL